MTKRQKKRNKKRASDVIVLKATGVIYFSQPDEDAFFFQLDKISCVKKYEGFFKTLYIHISKKKLNRFNLQELLALFYRYKIDMKQFKIFDYGEYSDWLRGKQKFWYKGVFGSPRKSAKT